MYNVRFEMCFVCGSKDKSNISIRKWACEFCWEKLPQKIKNVCSTGIPDYIPEEQYERHMKEYYEKNN